MRVKFIKEEDFINYKKPAMFIGSITCDWKCCKEQNIPITVCQNEPWAQQPIKDFSDDFIVERYMSNPLTSAIVVGGLEPFLQFEELENLIACFRCQTDDDIVVYTGYVYEEICEQVTKLKRYKNIIIKYGRYVQRQPSRYDDVLGVTLASANQYAKKIS